MDVLLTNNLLLDRRTEVAFQIVDAFLHDLFRSTGAGGDEYRIDTLEPVILDLGDAIDKVRGDFE